MFYDKYLKNSNDYSWILNHTNENRVQNIQPSDLRHIAIINLHFQGVAIHQMLKLAGQKSIEMSAYYGSNFTDFVEAISIFRFASAKKERQNQLAVRMSILNSDQLKNNDIGSICSSPLRANDEKNIENCIEQKCLSSCWGCTYYTPNNNELQNEIYIEKEKCKEIANEIKNLLENVRIEKGYYNKIEKLYLNLHEHLARFSWKYNKTL